MKKRSTSGTIQRSSEFKGVVKKITGKLTNDAKLEREGREEMLEGKSSHRQQKSPDPHRRG